MASISMPYVIAGSAVAATIIIIIIKRRQKKSYLVEAPEDTVVLRQMSRGPYVPSLSPFPLKLETYLRMAKIPYKSICGRQMSPRTGKTPWAQLNGEILTDSQLIIERLNKHFKVDTMERISVTDKAAGRAFRKMIEENTYWCLVRYRWTLDPDQYIRKTLKIPSLVFWMIARKIKQTLHGQGIGRLTVDEMLNITRKDLAAVSDYLGDKRFLLGDQPCEVDCAIFGMLAQFKWDLPNSPLHDMFNDFSNLNDYCERMKERFWSDWDECITHGGTRKATK